jgi:hypothetical protein
VFAEPLFATTTQAYEDLQLRPFLVRQGLAFRLNNGVVEEDVVNGIHRIPMVSPQLLAVTGEFMDLPKTDALLREVFVHRGGLRAEILDGGTIRTGDVVAALGVVTR